MLDRNHSLYILISGVLTIVLLGLCNKFVKDQKYKDKILKLAAILTVVIHYSVLYVDYFSTGLNLFGWKKYAIT